MRRALPAIIFILVFGSAAIAEAQVPNNIMNLFGTIINNAGAEAQRQQARDAWSKFGPDLVACLQQQFSLFPQQLAEQGLGPHDSRVRPRIDSCNQLIADQQRKAQADEEQHRQARDAWMQVDPEVIACVDRSYSSTSQQLAGQGIGPRDPRVVRYVNRCVDVVTNERNKAERQKVEREQEIAKKKKEEAAVREKAAQEAKQQAQAEAAAKEAAQTEEKKKKEQAAEIAANPKLQFLSSGAPEDLIAIVNIGPKAPHAAVDLHGQLVFTDAIAAICVGEKTKLSPVEIRLYNQDLAAVKVDPVKLREGHCNSAAALGALDMLVLRRAEILQSTFGDIDSLIKGLSSETYIKGFTITTEDVKATEDKREVELSTLKNAIERGAIKGYGVITVTNHGKLFCNTAAELTSIFPDLSHDLMSATDFENIDPAKLQTADVDTDTAFVSLKKEQCRAVFGNAESLRTLMDGLTRDKVAFSLDGRWIPEETVAAYGQGKSEQAKKRPQEEPEARQKLVAEPEPAERRAEGTEKVNAEKQQAAEPRVALVIGNGAYRTEGVAKLKNPANDARAIAQALRDVDFRVIEVEDADLKTMQKAFLEFGRALPHNGTALFYYAGHGMQLKGQNYLIPIDATIKTEDELPFETFPMEVVTDRLNNAQARVALVILDACRDSPFGRGMRGASRGLAAIDAARGTLIAYATAPGAEAADGDEEHGLYTSEVLKAMKTPGLEVEQMFRKVRLAVAERSDNRQIPWESSSLIGEFYFKP